jgi:DNA repair exonuclease SbcCD nuclease subunit
MSFTFIHTADWQIGKPFGSFPDDVRVLLREARFDVVGRIAAAAKSAGAAHVLVAGDVFDSANPPVQVVTQLLGRLSAHKGLVWHLLPGNHDPAQPGGVWDIVKARLPSSGVRLHLTAEPVEIATNVVLMPAPLKAKALAHDPTAYMDGIETARGVLRIGFAHGSVQGFGGMGDAAVPIDPTRDRRAKLDYFALGDWHGRTKISDRTWYSGTPEPDGYKDNDPGSVLVVTLSEAGAVPVVTPVTTASYLWLHRAVALTSLADANSFVEMLETLEHPSERRVVSATVSGELNLREMLELEVVRERVATLGRYVDWDQTHLRLVADDGDFGTLGSPTLSDIAKGLKADAVSSAVAGEALRLLTRYARGLGA